MKSQFKFSVGWNVHEGAVLWPEVERLLLAEK